MAARWPPELFRREFHSEAPDWLFPKSEFDGPLHSRSKKVSERAPMTLSTQLSLFSPSYDDQGCRCSRSPLRGRVGPAGKMRARRGEGKTTAHAAQSACCYHSPARVLNSSKSCETRDRRHRAPPFCADLSIGVMHQDTPVLTHPFYVASVWLNSTKDSWICSAILSTK